MDIKNKNLKAGNENGIIIAILAILLVLVLVIVGTVVLKDNAAVAKLIQFQKKYYLKPLKIK